MPGVGPSTAVRYVAALDVVARFASAHKVANDLLLGLGFFFLVKKIRRKRPQEQPLSDEERARVSRLLAPRE